MNYQVTIDSIVYQVSLARTDTGFVVTVGEETHQVDVSRLEGQRFTMDTSDRSVEVHYTRSTGDVVTLFIDNIATRAEVVDEKRLAAMRRMAGPKGSARQTIASPMPGKVVKILKHPGDLVEAKEGVIIVEAMKMENELRAVAAGRVASIIVEEGDTVESGQALVIIEPPQGDGDDD